MKKQQVPWKKRRGSNEGLALFVVLVTSVVLFVIVTQLCYTVGVEETIALSRRYRQSMELALVAASRGAIFRIQDDRVDDASEASSDAASAMQGAGGLGNLPGAGMAGSGGDTTGDGAAGGNQTPPALPTTIDGRHEDWARKSTEQINEFNVEVRMSDGESRIDLNHLFSYAQLPTEAGEQGADGAGNADADGDGTPDEVGAGGGGNAGADGSGAGGESGGSGADAGGDEADGEDEVVEEWAPPSPEQELATQQMLSRLVEAVIGSNLEQGFEYTETPNPDLVADAIVRYVRERASNERTRVFRTIDPLLDLPEIGWELFHGPPDPSKEEAEGADDNDGERDDELVADEVATEDSQFGLVASLASELGIDLTEFEELADGEGVEQIARPLGLRDVFTAYSSGKINLNTARPEIITALLSSFPDFNEAWKVAHEIDAHLNRYADEPEDSDAAGAGADAGAAAAGASGDAAASGEEEEKEFNLFRSLDDLGNVNEEWADSGVPDDDAVLPRLKADLKNAVFGSQYFAARLIAKKGKGELEGEVTLWHDATESKIRVLAWRILTP